MDYIKKYLFEPTGNVNYFLAMIIKVFIIIIAAKIFIALINKFINRIIKLSPKFKFDDRKSTTLIGVLKSFAKYSVYIIAGISMLNVMNFPTQSLIAAAGLGGIAIGFGAQSLVKDIVSGFFILFEDQYSVGDYVTILNMTGTVEDIELRITKIRAYTGEMHIIPNGEIKTVTNHSRGNSLAVIDMAIAYESDEEKAINIMEETAFDYYEVNKDIITDKPEVLGLIKFNENNLSLRITMNTLPLKHWQVEREMRKLLKQAFGKAEIKMPYTRVAMINASEIK